ncbi:MAG: thioesterase [Synechococcales cyanobacterium M58_A2018_015]|nr:thioesterase [Synechococcales cyanobacterium M58_A2018_015]
MTSTPINAWITCPHPNPHAKLRLFCLPYAGGGTLSFRTWAAQLPHVEVCPIQLPGRERRLSEPPFQQLEPLVQTLATALLPHLKHPFALFGHSMGGLIAFELARYLRRQHQPQPVHLFISGCRAPQLPNPNPILHTLPDADFIQELRRYNGTPEAVITNAELMELLLPTLRADFALVEQYIYYPEAPLDCPITIFGGLHDPIVDPQLLSGWQMHSCQLLQYLVPGDHFFLHSHAPLLLQTLSAQLAPKV